MGAAQAPAVVTPDGRYLVVRGRLWRRSDPRLAEPERQDAVHELMAARREVATARRTADTDALTAARARVQAAKERLGERGPVWWDDGAPDLTRHLARNTVYADWFAELTRTSSSNGASLAEYHSNTPSARVRRSTRPDQRR